ncbi:MAG: hypothetical protein A2474_06240 [Elusimicrobia bacterium RIFOXYC2_FULL_34_12]|nr:MAG: hypothetical protein A2474_06240 [Elusimicrobia bacterium RIFOXYC2_FULL_34_12]OGS38251.1 MAG: hypothetical protein A2551_03950 [Elusimicrobia bacterium RIFOXYD2_FULL_34_30]HAM38791.1 hypothetical protein [Elusimicrobiota bacterium]
MDKNDKIYIAGHNGLIGAAILRRLITDGYTNIITKEHSEINLCDQSQVKSFFEREKPDYVFLAAAKVGGVFANSTYRADFIYENIMIQNNIIHNSFLNEVKKLIFLCCADAYPKECPQPAKEEYLLTGPLEPTCEPFALAKIAGIKMCESYNRQYGTDFIVTIPPSVYGPNQHYDILNAQVLPSLIKKFHEAKISNLKEVLLWGTGSQIRDFLFVDDVADACIFLMNKYSGPDFINIGTNRGTTIKELAEILKKVVGYKGKISFDKTKPGGVSKKLLDISKIKNLGWKPKTDLLAGIKVSYNSFLNELENKSVRTSKICDIKISERDINALKRIKSLRKFTISTMQPNTYKNKIVLKPWGYEFLVFENTKVAVWFLHIEKGNATSMHCHPQKKTSLIILSGTAMSNTFMYKNFLKGGDAVIIEKGVFHYTKVLSDNGLNMLEIESPPNKTDLVRLEDRYGRESAGYESVAEMETQNLKNYGYFSFKEKDSYTKYTHTTDNFVVSLEIFNNNSEFQKNFKIGDEGLYTSCGGKLLYKDNSILLNTGDTQKADILYNTKDIHISEKIVILKTFTKDK